MQLVEHNVLGVVGWVTFAQQHSITKKSIYKWMPHVYKLIELPFMSSISSDTLQCGLETYLNLAMALTTCI